MNEPVRTATAALHLSYSQFVVTDWNSRESISPTLAASNGLVGTNASGAVVLTGIHTGNVNVTAELLDNAPGSVDLDEWDEVVEVSVESEDGELIAHGIMDDPPEGLPELAHAGPGTYRLRVHARGRDTAVDATRSEPVEDYKLSVWPAPEAAEAVYKQSDRRGAEIRSRWRRE